MTAIGRKAQPIPSAKAGATFTWTCVCIDWYSEDESQVVEVGGVRVTIRFVGRNGRRREDRD